MHVAYAPIESVQEEEHTRMDTAAPRPDQMAVPSDTPGARRRFTITITTRTMWVGALR